MGDTPAEAHDTTSQENDTTAPLDKAETPAFVFWKKSVSSVRFPSAPRDIARGKRERDRLGSDAAIMHRQ